MTPRHRVLLEWALLALLVLLFVKKALIAAWYPLNTDFPNYFLAATLYRKGFSFEHFYDWVWFQRQKDHAGIDWGVVGYIPLSPFSALAFVPLTGLPPLAAKHVWTAINVGFLGATVALIRSFTRLGLRRVALIVFLTIVPLETSFMFGQQHLLVLLLLSLAAWFYFRDRDVLSGIVLALAAALKIYPALFALYFIAKRRFRALTAIVASGVVLGGLSFALFGREAIRVYLTEVIPRSLAGECNDPYYPGFNTPTVLLRRIFVEEPELNPHPIAHSTLAFALLAPIVATLSLASWGWFVRPSVAHSQDRQRFEWGAFVALLLVLSTGSSTYHFCALILATALMVDFLVHAGRTRVAVALVALHALVSAPLYRFVPHAPAGYMSLLAFPRLYALTAYWGLVVWALARVEPPSPWSRRAAVAFGVACVAITGWGVGSNLRHYEGLLDVVGERVPLGHPAPVSASPAPTDEGVYFSRMADEGYVLDRTSPPLLVESVRGVDLFHPSFPLQGQGWVEVSSRVSRVARLTPSDSLTNSVLFPIVLDDAESPTASRDGKWLAFLRERDGGHAALWTIQVDSAGQPETRTARELTDASYDVLDVGFFPDNRILFAAEREGGTQLFTTGAASRDVTPFETPASHARYPSVSPDGGALAYSGLEHGAWQLHLFELGKRRDTALTHADCNSVSPAWTTDGHAIVYASDCGRNVGNSSLRRVKVFP